MKPMVKLLFFIGTPLILGYLFRIRFDSDLSNIIFVLMSLGGVLVLPMVIEMIYKSQIQKLKTEGAIKTSKLSGYLFIVGIVLFFMALGYTFGD